MKMPRLKSADHGIIHSKLEELEAMAPFLANVQSFSIGKFHYPELIERIFNSLMRLKAIQSHREIPCDLTGCENLISISITGTMSFRSLDTLKVNQANITSLQLYNTGLSGILDLSAFTNLITLDISNTEVTEIWNLPATLENAYLTNTRLTNTDCFVPAKDSLNEVFLDSCPNLVDIRGLCECRQLEMVNVSNCNIGIIPETIGQLQQLEELDLDHNPITSLPDSIMSIRTLTYISIDNCPVAMNLTPEMDRFINAVLDAEDEIADDEDSMGQFTSIFYNRENTHDTFIQNQVTAAMVAIIESSASQPEDAMISALLAAIPAAVDLQKRFTLELHWKIQMHIIQIMARVWYLATLLDEEARETIRSIINTEITEITLMEICFTGACGRMVSALSGFYDFANIQLSENQYLNNMNMMITKQLGDTYTPDVHRSALRARMTTEGFNEETIREWLTYIED